MSVKGVTKVVQSTEPNSWRLKDLKHEHTVDNYWQSTIDQLEAFTQTFFHQDAIRSLTLRNASSASVSAFSPSSPLPSPHRASWQPPSFPSPISTRKSLFQLCYYTTLLTHTSHFLARISKTYVQKRSALFDPRKLVLFPSLIHEITRDALLYEEFKNITVDIVDAVRERLDLLSHTTTISTTTATGGGGGPPPEFKIMASKLTWSCSHAQKTAFRFVDTLNQLLKLLEVSRTVDESIRLRILSILASVFLPLSVAGSLLSMQTRLRDVGVLLWDFVGVTLLLASFLFVLFLVIRVYLVLQERLETWQGHGEAHLVVKATLTYGMRPALVTIWAITMIAFLLGMFEGESIGLGAQVLGYGVLLPSAVAILVGIFIWGVISGKQTMKDKEKGQGKQGRSWTFISLTDFRRRRQSKYTKADAA